jgi:hypothetical protein
VWKSTKNTWKYKKGSAIQNQSKMITYPRWLAKPRLASLVSKNSKKWKEEFRSVAVWLPNKALNF